MLTKILTKTETGYSRDFINKEGNSVMVNFNTFNGLILLAKDMLNKKRYLSTQEFNLYEEKYSDENRYGEFFNAYTSDDLWEVIAKYNDSDGLIIQDNALSIFDESTLDTISNVYKYIVGDIIDEMDDSISKEMIRDIVDIRNVEKTETGYSKDFIDKEGNLVMVDFNSFNSKIWLAKDMSREDKYFSTKEFYQLEEEYFDEYGCADFWEEIATVDDNGEIIMLDNKASSIFDKYTLKNIKETFMALFI